MIRIPITSSKSATSSRKVRKAKRSSRGWTSDISGVCVETTISLSVHLFCCKIYRCAEA